MQPRLIPVLLTCTLTGCFTIWYEAIRSPQVSGVISDRTIPLRRMEVTLSTKDFLSDSPARGNGPVPCGFGEATTMTDDSGQFSIGPVKRPTEATNWGSPGNYWSVCVKRDDGASLVVLSQFGRFGEMPATLRVNCDVSDQAVTMIEGRAPIRGKCKVVSTSP
jgi:hypothetical protein